MNSEQARALVADTFPKPFDRVRFHQFVKELLNGFNEEKAQTMAVPDAFAPHVRSCIRLGTYESPQRELADVLIVNTTEPWKIERTRTALRDFVAHKLKRGDNPKDAALVAFVSPAEKQWRFSYVKMEYAAVETDAGRAGVETRLTPARRFSYIVGEGESCHTAQSRFLALLQDTENYPRLAQIEDAFSVEAVTKEFFKKYAELFEQVHAALDRLEAKDKTIGDEFKAKHVSTVDFAKKLMGQIVFLHFLQKKGWLGVARGQDWGTGPHNFLRRLADQSGLSDRSDSPNFFNDVLEPLFYDTLATDRGHEAWCNRFKCRIPFLNGGLFEPLGNYDWRKTDIILPNKLFTNSEFVEFGVTGTGVLDVFDRYNFTVNEAEPLEKEVAIDPEMLGKVFENLIEENRRKGLGSYYTPREIVHYMCQESLINYLATAVNNRPDQSAPSASVPRADLETFVHLGEQISHYEAVEARYAGREMPKKIKEHAKLIDEKLADITICDPAVGSGAFPVGMMTEIVRARSALTPYFNDVNDRTPYHFKRHAIQNCLYGVDIDPGAVEIAKLRLWLSLVVDEEDVRQIKPLPNLFYKIVTGNSLLGVEKNLFNQQLFQKLEKLKPLYFDQSDQSEKAALRRQIEDTIHELTNGKEAFDFEIYFSEAFHRKGGFDVVIANPPYVRQEKIKELKPALKAFGYECFNGTADLLVYFYERCVKLLRPGGAIALITSNKYYRAGYGEALRGFLPRELTLHRLIDFGDTPVFEAIAYASILTGTRTPPPKDSAALGYTWEQEQSFERITQIVAERGQKISQSEFKPDGWRLESPAVLRLLDKLRRSGKPLGEYVNGRFYYGIKTGLNEAFVVDRATRDRLIRENKSSVEILKPFLRGRDVKRWRPEFAEQYLIKIESSENKDHPWSGKSEREAERVFTETHPAIHTHFESFRAALKNRDDQGKYFWELRSCIYWQEFEQPKIIYPNICDRNEFAWDDSTFYANQKTFIITGGSKYLLGVLNSSVVMWLFWQLIPRLQNDFFEPGAKFLGQFSIPAASSEKQKAVERLVDRILAAKQCDAEADVSALERETDELVYALYGLTPEEIKIVEGAK